MHIKDVVELLENKSQYLYFLKELLKKTTQEIEVHSDDFKGITLYVEDHYYKRQINFHVLHDGNTDFNITKWYTELRVPVPLNNSSEYELVKSYVNKNVFGVRKKGYVNTVAYINDIINTWVEEGTPKLTALQNEWVEALLQEEYKKGLFRLKEYSNITSEHYHCCLGVACEVYNKRQKRHKKKQLKEVTEDVVDRTIKKFNGIDCYLPAEVLDAIKLKTSSGYWNNEAGGNTLTHINDSWLLTHKEIGHFIKNNPELLFEQTSK